MTFRPRPSIRALSFSLAAVLGVLAVRAEPQGLGGRRTVPTRVEVGKTRALVVRVVDEEGAALPGATVARVSVAGEPMQAFRTDVDGCARLAVAIDAAAVALDVAAPGAFHRRAWFDRAEEIRVVLHRAVVLSGVVRDRVSGGPLAGAELFASHPECDVSCAADRTRTDAQGRYELTVPGGARLEVWLTASEHAWTRAEFTVPVTPAPLAGFSLPRGALVEARVRDGETLAPLVGARLRAPGSPVLGVADAEGVIRARLEPGDAPAAAFVEHAGHAALRLGAPQEDAGARVELLAPRAVTIEGSVEDRDGRPIAGARLDAQLGWPDEDECPPGAPWSGAAQLFVRAASARTTRDGRFRFEAAPCQRWTVSASAPGFHSRSDHVATGAPGSRAALRALLLPRAALAPGTLRGRVLLNGVPVAAPVHARQIFDGAWHEAELADDGRYRFEALAGSLRLSVDLGSVAPGLPEWTARVSVAPGRDVLRDLRIELSTAPIAGRIVDATGRPCADLALSAHAKGAGAELRTDADGRFLFTVVADGSPWELWFLHGHADYERRGVLPGTTDADFVVAPSSRLELRLVDPQSAAARPIIAFARGEGEPSFRWLTLTPPDAEGWSGVELPLGRWDLSLRVEETEPGGFRPVPHTPVRLDDVVLGPDGLRLEREAPLEGDVTFVLAGGSELLTECRVVLAEPEWVDAIGPRSYFQGCAYSAQPLPGFPLRERTLAQEEIDRVTLRGVAPGRYVLRVVDPGFTVSPSELAVDPADPAPVRILLQRVR